MPKHRKDSDSSDSSSGPDDRNEPTAKKSKSVSGAALKNESGETYFDIEKLKRITVREFKGKVLVDIREYYEKDGKILPGKKGITLSPYQWNKVKSLTDEVDVAIKRLV